MRLVDLRSDTVTLPTAEMRRAMYEAEVGDDVYREDPTVAALEELGAEMTGKEAGLFVVSGTMGNQVAALAHTARGDEVICEADSHIYMNEVGALACLAGTQVRTVPAPHGIMTAAMICGLVRHPDVHTPRTGLICLENTHNRAGGTCYPLETLAGIKALAEECRLPVHIDGARVFNAAAALGVPVREIARHADSLQFCLSKGLCAPVGSLLVGGQDFIAEARRYRKMLGGGMRQAGVIAAAGIVALRAMTGRLAEDHALARVLAEGLANIGYKIDLSAVQTNIVIFETAAPGGVPDAAHFAAQLAERGVKASVFGQYRLRFVTHYGISRADIDYTLEVLAALKPKQD